MSSMDLPFEESPGESSMSLADAALCGGVVALAALLPTPFGTVPAVVLRFVQADGSFLPPVVLTMDAQRLQGVGGLINQAAETAVRRAS